MVLRKATAAEWLDADREAVTVKTQWLDEVAEGLGGLRVGS